MKLLVLTLLLVQPGLRPPLKPAETLLEPAILDVIRDEGIKENGPDLSSAPEIIQGGDPSSGEIMLASDGSEAAGRTMLMLRQLIDGKRLTRPTRTIRLVGLDAAGTTTTKAAIVLRGVASSSSTIQRNLWSTPSISDEVLELFARHFVLQFDYAVLNSPTTQWEGIGIPTTGLYYNRDRGRSAAIVAAASIYFLATLPNAGSEALLSHLMVGAHARLAEDGRRAVAMMGSQQRASGEVLTMFANAIDREQRRIGSFERFMPAPVDAMLHSRIVDMQKDITGVWSSIGITPSPFVPPAERIRGRGGEDRRVAARLSAEPLPKVELPTAFLKFENVDVIVHELGNFIDGKRSISDIRDAVSSEFTSIALPVVVEYFERLAGAGAISLK